MNESSMSEATACDETGVPSCMLQPSGRTWSTISRSTVVVEPVVRI